MGYNIIDIIEKAIKITKMRKKLYIDISNKKHQSQSVKIISKVLADNAESTFIYYDKLKNELINSELEIIDFVIYDRISFLIDQFNLRLHLSDATTPVAFIAFSLDLEKEILALFLDIQGRLIKTFNDSNSITYTILTDIIKNKTNLIHDLENLC